MRAVSSGLEMPELVNKMNVRGTKVSILHSHSSGNSYTLSSSLFAGSAAVMHFHQVHIATFTLVKINSDAMLAVTRSGLLNCHRTPLVICSAACLWKRNSLCTSFWV